MFLDASTMEINREEFELVPEARRPVSGCAVNLSPSGQVSLNKRLLEEIKQKEPSLHLGFAWRRKDRAVLLLYSSDTPNYTFPASGSRKDTNFSQALIKAGISLPARYAVSWNEEASAWVGLLVGECRTDALEVSLQNSRQNKRRKV